MKADPRNFGFSTRAVHAGQKPDPRTGSVAVPIYQTSTYVQEYLGEAVHYEYARVQNPTREALEEQIMVLEGGVSGHAFASGMAAIACLMTVVQAGDHVVVSRKSTAAPSATSPASWSATASPSRGSTPPTSRRSRRRSGRRPGWSTSRRRRTR